MMVSANPATGERLMEIADHDEPEIERRLAAAFESQRRWAGVPLAERMALLRRAAAGLRQGKAALARIASLEMGKPITEALAEVEKCATGFDYYADAGQGILADRVVATNASDSRIVYEPLGLVLAVMPWNYPFWQVMRAAAPVLVGGNGLVLKHASNVPQCALAIERLFVEAGFPEHLVTTLLAPGDRVGRLIQDRRIAAVTFTGSTPVGRRIAAQAGEALKKQVLELGGSDPFIVLADADVEAAAKVGVRARFQNTGQSCIAAKRFIVEAAVADRFVEAFCAEVRALRPGDPLDPGATQGSMARLNLREELDAQVQASVGEGARLLLGGQAIAGPGAFYQPTVLDQVSPDMTVAREETFGPAAAILRVADPDEAVRAANGTPFGLGAALWTADLDRAAALVRRIEAGAVFVNGMVASDPRMPFGGVKESGYGRELGAFGVHEFANAKTVWTGPAHG